MKLNQTYSNRLGTLAALAAFGLTLGAVAFSSHAGPINWNGNNTGHVGNFSYCDNWYGSSCPTSFGGWVYGNDLHFSYNGSGSTESSIYNDYTSWQNIGNIYWDSTFSAPNNVIPLNGAGNGINFNQKIENDWSGTVTNNIPTSGGKSGSTDIELNPVAGNLIINNNVYNDNNLPFYSYGNGSMMLTINYGLTGNNTVSLNIAAGGGYLGGYGIVKLTAAQGWGDSTHGVNINQGEFWMDSGGSLASSSVPITVGLSDGNTAKLWLSVLTGGQNLTNPITLNNQSSPAAQKTIGGLNTSGTSTFYGGIILNGQANLSAGTGGTVVFAGPISGSSQNVVVNGYQLPLSGVVVMSGTNTYSGNTYISGGTLQFNSTGSAGSSPVFYLGETSGSQTATLTLGATGGGQSFTNSINVRSGSSGAKTISGLAASGTNRLAGSITLADNVAVSSAGGGNLALSGVISGSFGLTNIGSGTTTLSNANTYSGGTTIKVGQISITGGSSGTSGPLGPNTANVYLGDTTGSASATLAYSGVSTTHAYPITVQSGSSGTKTIANLSSVALVYSGSIALNDSLTLDPGSATGTINLSGPVTGAGGIVKINSSKATLSATSSANQYTGNTTISQGSLQVGSGTAIPNGSGKGVITLNPTSPNTATFDLNGNNQTVNGLTNSGTGSAVVDDASSTSVTLTVGTSGSNPSGTFSGVIQNSSSGTLGLTKAGSGTLTLNGASTYGGNTTITAGTLALGGSGSINNSTNITIAAGATYDVSAYATYTLSSSATLSASGAASAATIKGGTTVSLGSHPIVLTYDGSHPALSISQGTLSLAGNAFTVNSSSALAVGTYTIVQQASGTITSSAPCTVGGTAIGSGKTGSVSVSGGNVILTVQNTTTATLTRTAGASPSTYGSSLTFHAVVSPDPGSSTITFKTNGVSFGTATTASGAADLTISTLPCSGGSAYTVTADFGGNASNTTSSGTLAGGQQVNQQTPLVASVPTAGAITYGQTLAGSGLTGGTATNAAGATVAGSFAFTASSIAPNAGSTNVSVTFTPTDAVDYNSATATVSVTVGKQTPTLTAPAATSLTYGQAFTNSTLSGGAATNAANSASVSGSFAFTTPGGIPHAGSTNAPLTFTPTDAADYNSATTTASVLVNTASLGITAVNTNKVYNGVPFSGGNGVTYAGFVNGETNTLLGGALSYGGTSQGATNAGSYTIVPSGLTSANYAITYANGSLTISQASTAVALSSASQTNGFKDSVTFTATLPANATGSVIFKTNSFALSTNSLSSGMATSAATSLLPRGTNLITAEYSGDGNYLGSTNTLNQVVTNHPPVVNANSYSRSNLPSWKITISDLLTNVSDVDGDPLALVSVGVSTNGITLDTNSYPGYVAYYNTSLVNDQFSYTVTDGFGGTNSAVITLTYSSGGVTGTNSITSISGGIPTILTAYGVPNYRYITERSTNLVDWVDILTNTAATNGVITITDHFSDLGGNAPSSAYYRLKWNGN